MQQKIITVTGMVQGVGFRPAVAELAEACEIYGQVKNMGGVVEILAFGEDEAMEKFLHRLSALPGRMDAVKVQDAFERAADIAMSEEGCTADKAAMISQRNIFEKKFSIVESSVGREELRFLPIDFPTCDRCREELFDKKNRRYRYPFISCTACGPRYSIQKAVPYDRDSITMGDFDMCPECECEYQEKGNIRRHAQTIACHNCGPQLKLVVSLAYNEEMKENLQEPWEGNTEQMLSHAVWALQHDKIVAVKDIGGFHFAFSPMSTIAAKRLREFKSRDKKPFAVMFPNMDSIREYCEVSQKEAELLTGIARPIVLLKKKKDFVPEICGDSDRMGVLLPCNPLQILLLEETGPLVMTSGNRGGEPIIISDEEMQALMAAGCPDLMLTHDREILSPLDDSIYQVNGEYVQLIRRARGLVPEPIELEKKLQEDIFAAGGDLKATFAYGRGKMIYLSQYFGDLVDVRCEKQREQEVKRFGHLLEIEPTQSVGDMHPVYVSAQNVEAKVQHHMAHVASVIAEHRLNGTVLGIACDGTGFGCDGTIWGSEFFLYKDSRDKNSTEMKRVGHFATVKLLGGDASAKEADKTLFSYRMEAKERGLEAGVWERALSDQQKGQLPLQEMAWKQNINTAYSSSMGRIFDAVSALLDICHYNSYEGECAILLEQAAHRGRELLEKCGWNSTVEAGAQTGGLKGQNVLPEELLRIRIVKENGVWIADSVKMLADLWQLRERYQEQKNWKEILAYVFHHAVAMAIVFMAESICEEYNQRQQENRCEQIALSGGSFINRILLQEVAAGLKEKGKSVYTNEKVPCGDGGIALGQAFLCGID